MAEEGFDIAAVEKNPEDYFAPPVEKKVVKKVVRAEPLGRSAYSAYGAEHMAPAHGNETGPKAALGSMDDVGELDVQEMINLQEERRKAVEAKSAGTTGPAIPGFEHTATTNARETKELAAAAREGSGPTTSPGFKKSARPASLGPSPEVERQRKALEAKAVETERAERKRILGILGGRYTLVRDVHQQYREFFAGNVDMVASVTNDPQDEEDWEKILKIYREKDFKHGKKLEKLVDSILVRKRILEPKTFTERFTGRKAA